MRGIVSDFPVPYAGKKPKWRVAEKVWGRLEFKSGRYNSASDAEHAALIKRRSGVKPTYIICPDGSRYRYPNYRALLIAFAAAALIVVGWWIFYS